MRTIVLFLFLSSTVLSFGQIKFEKGYFIDNNNQKIDCSIKNDDWRNNPQKFKYKLNDNLATQEVDITEAREVVILGSSKYIRANVKIDRSFMEGNIQKLSFTKNPVWSAERLFLKVVLEGKASLYSYQEDNMLRFFYSVKDTLVNQLIYKEYLIEKDGEQNIIAANFGFRQQVWLDVKCPNANMNSVKSLQYNKAELEKYFKKYNECSGDSFLTYNKVKQRSLFHLRMTPGINYSSFSISEVDGYKTIKTNITNTNYRIGLEGEFILPFNKNKWSLLIEPTYQYFKGKSGPFNLYESLTVDYSSIEFPVGIRHYTFLNDDLKLFVNGFIIPPFGLYPNSKISRGFNYPSLNIAPPLPCYAFGGGINYKGLSVEVRYYTEQMMLKGSWDASYSRVNVVFGFKLL